jgi:hypothetical protein
VLKGLLAGEAGDQVVSNFLKHWIRSFAGMTCHIVFYPFVSGILEIGKRELKKKPLSNFSLATKVVV